MMLFSIAFRLYGFSNDASPLPTGFAPALPIFIATAIEPTQVLETGGRITLTVISRTPNASPTEWLTWSFLGKIVCDHDWFGVIDGIHDILRVIPIISSALCPCRLVLIPSPHWSPSLDVLLFFSGCLPESVPMCEYSTASFVCVFTLSMAG